MSEHTYRVEGMTCTHCVAAVTEEVSKIPGAEHVEVDLESKTLSVTGEAIEVADVRAASRRPGTAWREPRAEAGDSPNGPEPRRPYACAAGRTDPENGAPERWRRAASRSGGISVTASSTNSGPELTSVALPIQNGPPMLWPSTQ